MGECFPKNKESTANYPSTDDESLEPGRLLGGPPPIGRFMGGLSPLRAVDLGGQAIAAALTRSEVASSELDEVIFGHVLVGGEGQITARQAAIKGGVPMTVPALNVNKVCISGLAAVGLASRSVRLGVDEQRSLHGSAPPLGGGNGRRQHGGCHGARWSVLRFRPVHHAQGDALVIRVE